MAEQTYLAALQEEKKVIVDQLVKEKALAEEGFSGLVALGEGLKAGGSLEIESLWSAPTNFSFKVSLKGDKSKAVYCKLSYEYSLLNPDDKTQIYPLSRVENEFTVLKKFASLFGGTDKAPVAEPYYCINVEEEHAKLSIFEWFSADDHFASQFRQGRVDQRVLGQVGEAMARLNLMSSLESDWNEEARGATKAIIPLVKQIFAEFVAVTDDQADVCIEHCKELGLERLETLVDKFEDEMMNSREVLLHNDLQQFNILVTKCDEPGEFDIEGKWALINFEMSIMGRSGRDIGIFHAYTIACAYCFAVQGNKKAAHHMLDCVMNIWGAYEMALRKAGKDDAYILDALKGSMGGIFGYGHIAYYMLGLDRESLPIDGTDETSVRRALGSLGKTSLQLAEIAYLGKFSQLGLAQLKMFLMILLDGEIDALLEHGENVQETAPARRRATMIAQQVVMGRRVSTDRLLSDLAKRRSSEKETLGGRASVYGALSIPAEILELGDDEEN